MVVRDHFSYPGAIEVGIVYTGSAKLVAGTGVPSMVGTGDITWALSID